MLQTGFLPNELIAFSSLRLMNQKNLLASIGDGKKAGIVVRDQVKAVLLSTEDFEELVNELREARALLEESKFADPAEI